jgi:hypothetical protein
MKNLNISITRTSEENLQVAYESYLTPSSQICIRWNNGLTGKIAMSVKEAKELEQLLNDILLQISGI